MAVDRTQELWQAVERACVQQDVPQETITQLKGRTLMRPRRQNTPFMAAALALLQAIHDLKAYINRHHDGYLSAGYTEAEKDAIELEVGAMVKECGQRVEQLKQLVLAGQAASAPARAQHSTCSQVRGEHVNEQTAAHRHGTVLSLAEQLHVVSSRFDKCRAQRYQQLCDTGQSLAAALATPVSALPGGAGARGAGGGQHSTAGVRGASAGGGVPSSTSAALLKAAKLGNVMFTHVKGATQSFLQQPTTVAGGGAGGLAGAVELSTSTREGAGAAAFAAQEQREQGAGGGAAPLKQQQQQVQLELENHDLVAQLMDTASAVHGVERTVREIATLNQLFSAAVLSQAEDIETIYANAVDASVNLKKGNVEIKKTIEVNKSSQRHIVVLLLVATLGLLFLDWFNS